MEVLFVFWCIGFYLYKCDGFVLKFQYCENRSMKLQMLAIGENILVVNLVIRGCIV